MADPHHIASLDAHDVRTVRLYRAGLVVSAFALVVGGALAVMNPERLPLAWVGVFAGAALSAGDMHLYDKRIRWVIGGAGWLGGVLMLLGGALGGLAGHWVGHAGLGFVFVTLSGFALKEQYCFRIPFLRVVPLLLATGLIPLLARQGIPAGLLLGLAGGLYGALALAKLRMPLHYDIGDKSAYEI